MTCPAPPATTIHATTVAIGGRAVLLTGPSGSGKSDLALRLIDRGAVLVSDDYTVLTPLDGVLLTTPPATIAGKIEVRGIGVLAMAHVADVPAVLVVCLDRPVPRLPLDAPARTIAGITLPELCLDAFADSAAIKVELALKHGIEGA